MCIAMLFWGVVVVGVSGILLKILCAISKEIPAFGCSFFAHSWKLLAYNGASLLIVVFGSFTYIWGCFAYSFSSFTCSCRFFVYNGQLLLVSTLTDCKQRSSTVSKKLQLWVKLFPPLLFSLWGDPLETARRTPPPEGCVSSLKQRSSVVWGEEGFRKEGE